MRHAERILKELEQFGILDQGHSSGLLVDHLLGTYKILEDWNCSKELCLAGLCHSIYGTESYIKETVSLESRSYVIELIGMEAELLAYYFGAHVKDHFWELLERDDRFEIKNRFTGETVFLNELQISNLVTLTLANWLEQRPRVDEKYLYIRQDEFLASERFLPAVAFNDFKMAYKLD